MPDVGDSERSPLVDMLLEMIAWQQRRIEELEQQILELKGETTKPKIKPSTMDKETDTDDNEDNSVSLSPPPPDEQAVSASEIAAVIESAALDSGLPNP